MKSSVLHLSLSCESRGKKKWLAFSSHIISFIYFLFFWGSYSIVLVPLTPRSLLIPFGWDFLQQNDDHWGPLLVVSYVHDNLCLLMYRAKQWQ
jgi:hypothetical protein